MPARTYIPVLPRARAYVQNELMKDYLSIHIRGISHYVMHCTSMHGMLPYVLNRVILDPEFCLEVNLHAASVHGGMG